MKERQPTDVLLSWSKLVPVSEGQDPLGLNLRVAARLQSQLLYCITTITPRARYYSFLPWCISFYNKKNPPETFEEFIKKLEKAFTLACVANHEGQPCKDGRLIGSNEIKDWYQKTDLESINLKQISYAKIPAYKAYIASLINLQLFKNIKQIEDVENQDDVSEIVTENFELSDLGQKVVREYQNVIEGFSVAEMLNQDQVIPLDSLKSWGRKAGLCELRIKATGDRQVLTDLFFNKFELESPSHNYRRYTLLLILYLSQKFSSQGCFLNETNFNDAVYYNRFTTSQGEVKTIGWPNPLRDTAKRWRMFHFHYYLSVAFENMFVNLVDQARRAGIEGFKLEDMIQEFNNQDVINQLKDELGLILTESFLESTPCQIALCFGIDIKKGDFLGSNTLNKEVSIDHPLSEKTLHGILKQKDLRFTPFNSVISLILWSILALRYIKWNNNNYGNWLANATNDPYQDISVPVVLQNIQIMFNDFWNAQWKDLSFHLIHRFIVQLHQVLAYQKKGAFFYSDQDHIHWRNKNYDTTSYKNPRLFSAILILKDLGLLAESENNPNIINLTAEGDRLLRTELAKEESG